MKSLKVKELDKYLDNHRLSKQGKKDDKIKAIMCNVLRENQNIITKKSIEISTEESDTVSDEDIAVIRNQSLLLLILTLAATKGNILKLNNLMFLKYKSLLLMRSVTCLPGLFTSRT